MNTATTTTTNPAPRLRALYRALLRELPPRPVTARTALHARLRTSFSASSSSSSSPSAGAASAASPQQAEQLVRYLRAQRQYATLLERYNPGMGMDEEERVRLTARRVGMDLPVEYEKDSNNNSDGDALKK